MYFGVFHRDIKDWDRFNALGSDFAQAPSNFKALAYYPNEDHTSAFCLWWADNVSGLRNYLDSKCAGLCVNDCFQIDEVFANGLPKVTAPA